MAQYLDKTGLTTLWTKIKYTFALKSHTHKKSEITDLTIPTVNNPTITINQGGVKKGSFSLNQSGAATIDLTDDNTTYSAATQSADGLMSAADKKKLEGIAEGANKITVDSALSSTSTNPVQNKVIKSALDGKANTSHDHAISDITGLYDELTGMTYVADSSDNSVQLETYGDGNNFSVPTKGYVDNALNGKSDSNHDHDSRYYTESEIDTKLNNYVTGTTFINYTTYIEGEVNKKANASHDHDISDINGLQSALDGKSNTGHGHTISNITNLQSTIESIYSDMGLQDEAIAGKADSVHTHTKSQITDFPTIPTVNNPTITINQGGTKKGSFSLNQSGATTIDLTDNNTWRGIQNNLTSDSTTDSLSAAQGKALANGSARDSTKLPLSGGTMTGNLSLKEYKNILLRPNNSSYTSGIGYDTRGNECIALWAKNSVTRLRWNAGVDMSELTSGKMMDITPDFEISKADGTARGYIAGQEIIHSGNIGSQSVNYASSAGDADTLDGNHASAFAKIASHNNLMSSGDEFTFASSGFSGAAWINYRTAGGTNGNITEYKLGNGAGQLLGSIIHSGNIGSQSVNYATSSHLLRTYNAGNGSHGSDYYLKCRHNVDGNDRFKLQIVRTDGSVTHSTSVDYANTSGTANYFNYGRGVSLPNSSSFTNNFCKDIFGEENNNNFHLVELRTSSQAPSCLLGDYSSGIAWKGSDTYGSLMVRYNTPEIKVSGGNGHNTNPNWTVDLVHSGNIGSQNVNYANSAGSARASNISMSSDGTTLTITYS